MDKRISAGREKYLSVHTSLLKSGLELLSIIELSKFSLKKLSEHSQYSYTTVYEHFDSSKITFLAELFEYLYKRRIEEYQKKYTPHPKENILFMFKKFTNLMNDEFLLWKNLKAARILIADKKRNSFFLIDELTNEAKKINLKPETIKLIVSEFYLYENSYLENPDKHKILTNNFIKKIKSLIS